MCVCRRRAGAQREAIVRQGPAFFEAPPRARRLGRYANAPRRNLLRHDGFVPTHVHQALNRSTITGSRRVSSRSKGTRGVRVGDAVLVRQPARRSPGRSCCTRRRPGSVVRGTRPRRYDSDRLLGRRFYCTPRPSVPHDVLWSVLSPAAEELSMRRSTCPARPQRAVMKPAAATPAAASATLQRVADLPVSMYLALNAGRWCC